MALSSDTSQSGNVLFLILIAVALFAALSFAVSNTMRGNQTSGITQEKEKINTAYLHQFPSILNQTIMRMRMSEGVLPEELSFAFPGNTDYGTFGSESEHEVFHPQGGGLPYQAPPDSINDGSDWIFNGDLEIENVGTTGGTSSNTELLAILIGIPESLCRYINYDLTSIMQTPPSVTVSGETNKYTGTFGYAGTISNPTIAGHDTYCYYSTNLGKYVFFKALIER
ncbi:MAG: hypothetical protein RBR86_05295 [Pseudobdellovibrionaceae bacterium]|jgi:hypothetical protein|nr:hypothetical protein [Pseudobdellovibrionaceae bacterium]